MPVSEKVKPLEEGQVECRNCGARYLPDFCRDYYGGENGRGGLCERCMMSEMFRKPNPVAVTDEKQLHDVCRFGKGAETCRYLAITGDKMHCAKGSDLHSLIDKRAPDMGAQGDHCSGPPDFQPLI